MKKLLTFLIISLGWISGLLISSFTSSLLSFGEGLTLLITLICVYIWGTRNDKDGFYRLFKDTHQSNLDDIERQELEVQAENNEEQETYFFDTSKLLYYPKKLIQLIKH